MPTTAKRKRQSQKSQKSQKRQKRQKICQKLDIDIYQEEKGKRKLPIGYIIDLIKNAFTYLTSIYSADLPPPFISSPVKKQDTVILAITTHGATYCNPQGIPIPRDKRSRYPSNVVDRGPQPNGILLPETDTDDESYLPTVDTYGKTVHTDNAEHTETPEESETESGNLSDSPNEKTMKAEAFIYTPDTVTVPENMEIHKFNVSAPGIVAYTAKDSSDLENCLSDIRKKMSMGLLTSSKIKNTSSNLLNAFKVFIHPRNVRNLSPSLDRDAFAQTSHLGYNYHKVNGGDKIVNKRYTRSPDETYFTGRNEMKIGEISASSEVLKDAMNRNAVTMEDIILHYKHRCNRLIIFDFSCSVFMDKSNNTHLPYNTISGRHLRREICKDAIAYGGNKNKNKNKNKTKTKKYKPKCKKIKRIAHTINQK